MRADLPVERPCGVIERRAGPGSSVLQLGAECVCDRRPHGRARGGHSSRRKP